MKRRAFLLSVALVVAIAVGVIGTQILNAQQELAKGTILQRAELPGTKGKEAVLVLRELPLGAETGKHYQAGSEVAYVLEGSIIVEVKGKPPVTLKPGDTFQTGPKQEHNVKNASKTAPAKVLVYYVTEKGKPLADISRPVK
jgi:quercetin dioxygenase-like cupin family protein